ncbi:Ubiquitin-conjugating enzyme E2 S [Pteropus alecto]|uniref:Ubiquitin-conjugating enzyme E2 S n=1 Tax=Pteropus alecto TaxID=9402 RepID=L5KHI2_PTEAL|nr:Ubiquitin-conjugating enzyme E2 S [Pteropus alecto]
MASRSFDLSNRQVTIEGPKGTVYAGGLSRMKLLLGKDFPAPPAKGDLLTEIFHPNVGASGEICANALKRDWAAELGIRHVLLTIKCPLMHPNREPALDEEAGRLLLQGHEEDAAASTDPVALGGPGGAEGPVARKHAVERDKKLVAKKKTDQKRPLRRL